MKKILLDYPFFIFYIYIYIFANANDTLGQVIDFGFLSFHKFIMIFLFFYFKSNKQKK
jgi:hypothetical protein